VELSAEDQAALDALVSETTMNKSGGNNGLSLRSGRSARLEETKTKCRQRR
jgi:hypothetical protein